MWSYKYTSSASTFTEHYRVGVRLEAVIPAVRLVEIFAAVTKEQRCKCFFFDAGVEKTLASPLKTLLARPDRDRKGMFVGLAFPADFPCHRSTKATVQRVSNFANAMGIGYLDLLVVPWPPGSQGHRALSDRGERQRDGALFLKTWKALQRLVAAGTIRALGVDRFLPWQLDFILSQSGPRPTANFLHVSLKSQQQRLVSYSHARQVEVVASLDTAETTTHAEPEEAGGGSGIRRDGKVDLQREGRESEEEEEEGGGGEGGEGWRPQVEDDAEDTDKAVLSTIALETDMTPAQVVTSWSMHRGLVLLHTAGSLDDGRTSISTSISASAPPSREGYRRSSFVVGSDVGTKVREACALLHPLSSRPVFYSPNKRFGFDLASEHVLAIDALDRDPAPAPATAMTTQLGYS